MIAHIIAEDVLARWKAQDEGARFVILKEIESAMPDMACDAVSDLLRDLTFRYGSPLRDEVLRLVHSNDIRRQVLAHLGACELEKADSLYEEIKSWWPRESYAEKKAEAETERSKQVSLKKVREALGAFAFSHAEAIYVRECSAWWGRDSYAQEVLAARQLQEKQLAEEQKRRIEAGRKQSQEKVVALLKQYAFTQAEELYIAACSDWWEIDSFLIEKRQWENHERRLVAELKQKIRATLSRSEFAAAIELFEKNPQRLWTRAEFDRLYAETKELLRIKRSQEEQKTRILKVLRDFHFDEARSQYATNCSEWWPRSDFEAELGRFVDEEALISRKLRSHVMQLLESRRYLDALAAFKSVRQISWGRSDFDSLHARFVEKHTAEDAFAERVVGLLSAGKLSELDALFRAKPEEVELSADEFWAIKDDVVSRVLKSYGLGLDIDQTHAVACPSMRALIRARAGSGKTRTLCARASVAIRDEQLDPDQVLMVAFNKSAADEVRQRMRKDFGCPDFENARTFHSLAYQLAKPKKTLLFDEGKHPSQRAQSGFVQSLLERILNPAFKELLYQFFRKEIAEVERLGRDLAPAEYRAFRRSLEQVSLKGGRVKSAGEKYIADFLFEHDIPYTYEKIWEWGTFEQGQPYKPDFTLVANGSDFILEHWAFDPHDRSAQLPDEWGMTADQYRQQIARKRMFWADKNITLLETHCGELAGGREAFELTLKERLEGAGIRCQKLPDEEIIRRVFENNFQISRMAEQFLQFIQRAKKRCLSVDGVGELIAERRTQDQRLHLFYQLALRVYREYESELAERGSIDFDDLLRQATEEVIRQGADARIHLGNGRFVKIGDLRWLLVDEYQDFSELYYRMLSAILDANPKIRLMAVGDDWQAINGFAGAELRFFTDFARYFPGAGEATIATNYRSARSVVTWGNRLMNGLGPEARPRDGALTGETKVVDLGKEWIEFRSGAQYEGDRKRDAIYFGDIPEGANPDMAAQRMARALKICVRLFHQTKSGKLLLLSRTKRAYGLELGDFRNRLVGVLATITGEDRQILRKKIRVMTAHTAKGQEEEAVVVLDASQTNFPKVHPDNLLYEIFGVTPAEVLAEEQRLFYVAITRPAETLWILTEGDTSSLYIKKLMQPALSDRAVNATPSSVPAEPSALYKRIKERIEALPSVAQVPVTKGACVSDPWSEVVEDVVDGLKPVVQKMRTIEGTPIPKVAFDLDDSGEFVGELAWPDQVPPLVVLAGEQSEHRERWELEGWMVLADGVAIRQGGAWLADQLTLLGELPPEKPHSPQRISGSVPSVESARGSGTIYSRIAGLFYSIGDILPSSILSVGHELDLIREPDNRHDSFAVKIVLDGRKLGYVPSAHSRTVARLIDNHHFMVAVVSKVGANDVEIEIRDR
jgi:DNA helicase-4